MPFSSNAQLPKQVKVLPSAAQSIFRNVFNSAFDKLGEERAFRSAWGAVKRSYKKKGDGWVKKSENDFGPIEFEIKKADEGERLVFGWASITQNDSGYIVDADGDIIEEQELEKAFYDYVRKSAVAGENHFRTGVGDLVECVVFTKSKQEMMDIDLGYVGAWVGYYVHDDRVWDYIRKGIYKSFSIDGTANREEIEVEEVK